MKTDLGCLKEKNRGRFFDRKRTDLILHEIGWHPLLGLMMMDSYAEHLIGVVSLMWANCIFFVAIFWFFLQHEFPVLQHFLPIVQSPTSRLKCQRGQMLIFYKIPWVYLRLLGKCFSFRQIFDKKGKFFVELTNLSTLFKNWFQICWLSPPQLLSWPLAAMDRWHLLILWIFQIFYFRSLLPPPFEGSDSFK